MIFIPILIDDKDQDKDRDKDPDCPSCPTSVSRWANRVAGGVSPPAPTPPCMRVPEPEPSSVRGTAAHGGSSNRSKLDPPSPERYEPLGFKPSVVQSIPQSIHIGCEPWAASAFALPDRKMILHAEREQFPDTGAAAFPLFPVAHAHAAAYPTVQFRYGFLVFGQAPRTCGARAGQTSPDKSTDFL